MTPMPTWLKRLTLIIAIGGCMLDRIIKNWKSTMEAILPALAAILVHFGFNISLEVLSMYAAAVYALILLFSKDAPSE